MSIKNLLIISLLSFGSLHAQDIVVQAFNYESTTRDTMIDFPNVDHNNYEKIIMLYSMRCKDGLVSTGADRNRGCGEWDYSCNTYITDESQTDSLKATGSTHEISSFSGDEFPYTSEPTYSYYESIQKNVTSTPSSGAIQTMIGSEDITQTLSDKNHRSQFLYTAQELTDVGMQSGTIVGLKLDLQSDFGQMKNLRVKLKNTTKTDLSDEIFDTRGFTTVYYLDRGLTVINNQINFNRPYNWNGNSNILVDISYDAADEIPAFNSTQKTITLALKSKDIERKALSFNRGGYLRPENQQLNVSSEISIAFWVNGGVSLPFENSIFEGVDADENRQVNLHMPWSNGEVFWDCGNDGSGYDRISKAAGARDYKNGWNHWVFTKNVTSGSMKIYLNGSLWHSGFGNHKLIDIQSFTIGNSHNLRRGYQGRLDQFSIWNKELSPEAIQSWMGKYITSDHPDYNNLILYYPFDNDQNNNITIDESPAKNHGNINGSLLYRPLWGHEIVSGTLASNNLPNMTFVQENNATIESTAIIKLDSLINHPNQVDEYVLQGSDRVLDNTQFLYIAGEMPVYNEAFNIIRTINVSAQSTINIGVLNYYRKTPMKYEIMSFVTPYGIGLDLGIEGQTWTFDVTDFGPILKGTKRINMQAGGEWQEDIDIKFVYVEGTPGRDVHNITQVWPVNQTGYTSILSDNAYEPRNVLMDQSSSMFKLKAAITGHGQQGEFIRRFHLLDVNGYNERQWGAWKSCGENPIFPQGGTWIYDRAGWCPGMATNIEELDLTDLVTAGQEALIDYGLTGASGDSRYFVNVQMVSYGEPNFDLDAEMADIMYPSNKIEYGRFNPSCGTPKILIKNNGEDRLTSLNIEYGINGSTTTFNWTGSLDFLETEEVDLPPLNLQMSAINGATFEASVSNPNGSSDVYSNNNAKTSMIEVVPVYEEDVIINFQTNSQGSETSLRVEDADGNVILSYSGALGSNREYTDTLKALSGCYQLYLRDLDGDGLSFFNNNDGSGFIRIKNAADASYTSLQSNFGQSLTYNFIAGDGIVGTDDPLSDTYKINVSPNPGNGIFKVELFELGGDITFYVTSQTGQILKIEKLSSINPIRHEQIVDLSQFPNGVYLLKMNSPKGHKTLKLVKVQ